MATVECMAAAFQRADDERLTERVRRVGDFYTVPSGTDHAVTYIVRRVGPASWECTCLAARHGAFCKHVAAVQHVLVAEWEAARRPPAVARKGAA